jgi:hypothetical protein
VNKRREVPTGIGISVIGKSEFSRSCALGQQQSRNPDGIWTVHSCGRVAAIGRHREKLDRRLHRRIGNRSFTSPVNNYNRNPEIAMKEIPTEPEPSDQHVI